MHILTLLRVFAVLLIGYFSVRLAWLGDDALITLRTALNASHGWGLGFNASESVQAYTHPLWFVMWTILGTLTGQWTFGVLAMGIALTAFATWLLVAKVSSVPILIGVTALLLFSNAFMEYSTSGLENPLAYALLGILITLTTCRSLRLTTNFWALLVGVSAAGLFLTRMDLIVLLFPVLFYVFWINRNNTRAVILGIGAFAAPTLAWFLWTYTNYSAFLPNTFAAKRNVDIPVAELAFQGMRYLWVGFENDPVTLFVLVAGIAVALTLGSVFLKTWALGVLLYLLYILWIGGDYMGGRFLAVPVYVCVFLIALSLRLPQTTVHGTRLLSARTAATIAGVVLLLLSVTAMGQTPVALTNPQTARWDWESSAGIADERGLSVERGRTLRTALIEGQDSIPGFSELDEPGAINLSLLSIHGLTQQWPTPESSTGAPEGVMAICGWLPVVGISTGPKTHLIDTCGLTDRFVADIPFTPPAPLAWRSGHLVRDIPEGYVEAVETGDPTRVTDLELATQLEQLWLQIRHD